MFLWQKAEDWQKFILVSINCWSKRIYGACAKYSIIKKYSKLWESNSLIKKRNNNLIKLHTLKYDLVTWNLWRKIKSLFYLWKAWIINNKILATIKHK